jgi:hypothetical protein
MVENQNRDVYPNENLDQGKSSDQNNKSHTGNKQKNKGRKGSSETSTRENTTSQGYGSSQRNDDPNVGPLDADLNELPSKRRTSGNNQTGSGLG